MNCTHFNEKYAPPTPRMHERVMKYFSSGGTNVPRNKVILTPRQTPGTANGKSVPMTNPINAPAVHKINNAGIARFTPSMLK